MHVLPSPAAPITGLPIGGRRLAGEASHAAAPGKAVQCLCLNCSLHPRDQVPRAGKGIGDWVFQRACISSRRGPF